MSTTPRHDYARAFWALQLGGWAAYAIALIVPWLGRYPISVRWSNKLVIAATGLVASSVLRLVYRRVARDGAGLATLGVTAVAASVSGAFVWNGAASAILGRSLQNDSVLLGALGRTFPRFDGVLYHALVLLTWSLLYIGARQGLRVQAPFALRYQIGPHFLFNALNAISTLVVTDRKTDATTAIARLADLLRVSLEVPEGGTITLASELEIVRAYVAIERVRFADRLQVAIVAEAATLDARLPAMMLQPLVENAVRHAVAARDEPTTITVSACRVRDDLVLVVSDDGTSNGDARGFGVGLANTRARLDDLYPGDYRFVAGPTPHGGYRVEISIPLSREPAMTPVPDVLEAQLA